MAGAGGGRVGGLLHGGRRMLSVQGPQSDQDSDTLHAAGLDHRSRPVTGPRADRFDLPQQGTEKSRKPRLFHKKAGHLHS